VAQEIIPHDLRQKLTLDPTLDPSRVDMGKIHEIKWRNYGETVGDRPGI
jgi:hypothetical protein